MDNNTGDNGINVAISNQFLAALLAMQVEKSRQRHETARAFAAMILPPLAALADRAISVSEKDAETNAARYAGERAERAEYVEREERKTEARAEREATAEAERIALRISEAEARKAEAALSAARLDDALASRARKGNGASAHY